MEETREGEAQREGSHLREAVGALRAVSHLLPPGRRVELLQIAADSLTAIRGNLEETVRARDRLEEALMECGPWLQHTLLADPGSLDEANRLIREANLERLANLPGRAGQVVHSAATGPRLDGLYPDSTHPDWERWVPHPDCLYQNTAGTSSEDQSMAEQPEVCRICISLCRLCNNHGPVPDCGACRLVQAEVDRLRQYPESETSFAHLPTQVDMVSNALDPPG
jgi:hypothetical protein